MVQVRSRSLRGRCVCRGFYHDFALGFTNGSSGVEEKNRLRGILTAREALIMIGERPARNEMVRKRLGFVSLMITLVQGWAIAYAAEPEPLPTQDNACAVASYPGLSELRADKGPGDAANRGVPPECGLTPRVNEREINRYASPTNQTHWEHFFCPSSRICHKPLYFEDRELERYGRCKCFQSTRSATLFAAHVLVLPLNKIHLPKWTCVGSPCPTR